MKTKYICLITLMNLPAFGSEIVGRSANEAVFETVTAYTEAGHQKTVTNHFTLFQPGLNYFSADENKWVESSDQIELADVGAKFRKGPFKLDFAANHNVEGGAILLTLPDGRPVKVQTIGLALTDPQTGESFWIGEAKDSNGVLDDNRIVYADAFTGVRADVVVKVGIGKYESDVVLREQIVSPQLVGLDPATCNLEIWHRIVEAPNAESHTRQIARANGTLQTDELLDFGSMFIGEGTAFLVGTNQLPLSKGGQRVDVAKERFRDNATQTTYMIESVPYVEAIANLQSLPQRQQASVDERSLRRKIEAKRSFAQKGKRQAPTRLTELLPPARQVGPQRRKVAAIEAHPPKSEPGFVMDYTVLIGAQNTRFKGDTTYYVTNQVNLTGTTVIEGNTVVKFPPYNVNAKAWVVFYGPVTCLTTPYSPATFTADADNSVGQTISTAALSGYYGYFNMYFAASNPNTQTLHDIQTRFSYWGMAFANGNGNHKLSNLQITGCYYGIEADNQTVYVHNALCISNIVSFYGNTVTYRAEHVTAHSGNLLFSAATGSPGTLYLTNSIFLGMLYSSVGVSADHVANPSSSAGLFNTVVGGSHYLPPGSPYRNWGNPNVCGDMRAILNATTTQAPLLLDSSITAAKTLAPRGTLDKSVYPDAGYHYPPIDYVASGTTITDATLTLTNGVVVAGYGGGMFTLQGSASVVSHGAHNKMNRLVTYDCVQEATQSYFANQSDFKFVVGFNADFQFTEITTRPQQLYARHAFWNVLNNASVRFRDSTLRNVTWWVNGENGGGPATLDVRNCIFDRCQLDFRQESGAFPLPLTFRNNLVFGTQLYLHHMGPNLAAMLVYDNLFDGCVLGLYEDDPMPYTWGGPLTTVGNNGYTSASATFGGANNKTGIVPAYQTGPLGNFYYPNTGGSTTLAALINAGSVTAAAAGLYHYTTTPDQVKEGSTQVDIGFHYVATTGGTTAIDSDSDGLADYVEDLNGNGNADSGETSYLNPDTDGDGVTDLGERNAGSNPLVAATSPQANKRLAYWSFDDPNFTADTGQICLDHSGGTSGGIMSLCFLGSAAHMTTDGSKLVYPEIGSDGYPTLDRAKGTVRFWFRPDWAIGQMPAVARLVSVGASSTSKDNWWTLEIAAIGQPATGATLSFKTQVGGNEVVYVTATLPASGTSFDWQGVKWHQIALTYESTNIVLYVDRALAAQATTTTTAPFVFTPTSDKRILERLAFGGDKNGLSTARGHFDEIETFNYPLTQQEIDAGYDAIAQLDDDHDGLSNLTEVDWVGSDPQKWDTDNDGMPDGFEYWWNIWRPKTWTPDAKAFHVADASVNDNIEFEQTGNTDGFSNVQEYQLGFNPYFKDKLAAPAIKNTPLGPDKLINIKFGSVGATGKAGAGFADADQWNVVGRLAEGQSLNWASGASSAAKISLRMELGHVTRFNVNCQTVTEGPQTGKYYCDWLSQSNVWQNVFCCTNLNAPNSTAPAQFFCIHSQTGEQMYLADQWYGGDVYQWVPGERAARALLPVWPWTSKMPFGAIYYGEFAIGPIPSTVYNPTTTARTLVMSDWFFQRNGKPARSFGGSGVAGTHVLSKVVASPSMESADIDGFDQQGAFVNGTGVSANPIMSEYLWNSMDGQLMGEPQSTVCNSYWFTGDGHGSILIEGLPPARYGVYLYAAKPGFAGYTPVSVNGVAVNIPAAGSTLSKFVSDLNFAGAGVGPTSTIQIDFLNNQSLINAIQILQLPPRSPDMLQFSSFNPAATATFDQANGVLVEWTQLPGVAYRVYRILMDAQTLLPTAPPQIISENPEWCRVQDLNIPLGPVMKYRIAVCDPWSGAEIGELESNTVGPIATAGWNGMNHAPSLTYVNTLKHTYKDTPFIISAGKIQQASDAFDFEGTALAFDVTEVISGTLAINNGGTITTYSPGVLATPVRIGWGNPATWTPPAGFTSANAPALKVQATDGAFESGTPVTVAVEVRDTSVLMWWGASIWGMCGTGESALWTSKSIEHWWAITPEDDRYTVDPTPLQVAPGQPVSGTDRRLINVVQLAVANSRQNQTRAALCVDGSVWTWGIGRLGALGDGQTFTPVGDTQNALPRYMTEEATRPIRVATLTDAQAIAAGRAHMLALRSDGSVWGWGLGDEGQLGVAPSQLPTMAAYKYAVSDGAPNTIHAANAPRKIPGLQNVVSIAADGDSGLAIGSSGEVYWWGEWNAYDPVTYADTHHEESSSPVRVQIPGRVTQVIADNDCFLALNNQGEVWGWGAGDSHIFLQTLPQNANYATTPVKLPLENVKFIAGRDSHRVAVLADGSVVQWGSLPAQDGWAASPQLVRGLAKIVKVSTSGNAALALDESGNVFGWGSDGQGVLGQKITLSDADRKFRDTFDATNPQQLAEWRVISQTPKWGVYKYPVQLDGLEWAEDIAIADDAGFAVAPIRSLSPRGLSAKAGNHSAVISWKRFPQATSYELQRRSSYTGYTTIASLPDNPALARQLWTDTGLENQQVYWYQVRALVAGIPTPFCTEIEAWPDVAPLAVTGLVVEPLSRQAHLYWQAQDGKVDYEVWKKVGSGTYALVKALSIPPAVAVHPNCGTTTLTGMIEYYDAELTAGTQYTYKVRARNDIDYGDYSQEVSTSGITVDSTGAPTGVTVTTTATTITVQWTTPSGLADQSKYILRVVDWVLQPGTTLTLQKAPERPPVEIDAGADGASHTQYINVEPGRKYTVTLSVSSPCVGESAPATWDQISTPAATVIGLDNLVVVGSGGALYARWHGNAVNYLARLSKNGVNSLACGLGVVVTPDENGFAEFFYSGLTAGSYTLSIDQFFDSWGATAGTTVNRDIQVSAVDPNKYLPAVSAVSANNRLAVTWWGDDNSRVANIANHLGWRFILERQGPEQVNQCPAWVTVYDGPSMGVDDGEVKNGSSYKYRVTGIDPQLNIFTSPLPPTATFTPGPSFGTSPSIALTPAPRNGAVELSWIPDATTAAAADEYEVHGSTIPGGPHPVLAVIGKGQPLNYVDLNVVNGVAYYYQVIANKLNGDSISSAEVSSTPQRSGTLLAPRGFIAEVVAGNIVVQWPESPGAESYKVSYNGGADVITKSPTFTVALPSQIQSNFKIVATARGADSWPGYFTFLTWSVPSCGGCNITYRVLRGGNPETTLQAPAQTWADYPPSAQSHTFDNFAVWADITGQSSVQVGPMVNSAVTSDFYTISLAPLPATVTSPTNLVVAAALKIANRMAPADRVEFYVDNTLTASVRTPPYQFTWVNPVKGGHALKARVVDPDGNVLSTPDTQITVNVVPELQSFQTSSTDLQIPAPGMPLTVSRSYDSRTFSSGMLGVGWKFDWERAGMSVPDLAGGWTALFSGNILVKRTLEEAPIHVIEVRLPNGAMQRFHPVSDAIGLGLDVIDNSDPDSGDGESFDIGHNLSLYFAPMDGFSGKLQEALGQTAVFIPADQSWTELQRNGDFIGGQNASDPRGFVYMDDDGTAYRFSGPDLNAPGPAELTLQSITNRFGATITRVGSSTEDFTLNHGNGKRLSFKKTGTATDYYWNVYDPIGDGSAVPILKYHVVNGLFTELYNLTDRNGTGTYAITRLQYNLYNGQQMLVRVVRPDGVIVLENDYDSTGLLKSQWDAVGLKKSVDPATSQDSSIPFNVTDNVLSSSPAAMAAPQATYDSGGQLTGVTQGSAASEVGYDSLGRPAYQATKVGPNDSDLAYTSYEYDSHNRIQSVTDALGNQSYATYTKTGDPQSVYDAKGVPSRYDYYDKPLVDPPADPNVEYDPEGALRSTADAGGNQTVYTYNKWGQVLTETHIPAGGGPEPVTSYFYDSVGNVLEVREPLWTVNSDFYKTVYTYDANGNRLTETRKRQVIVRNTDGTVQLQNGNPVMTTETITTTFNYDAQNRLTQTQNPIGDWSTSVYDANGKVTQSTSSLGQLTSYTYDPRGNLIETKFPDGTASRTIYDERGRVIWTQERCTVSGTDTAGPATQTVYDSQGRVHFTRRYQSTYFRLAAMASITEANAFDASPNLHFRRLSTMTAPTVNTMTLNDSGTLVSSVRTEYDVAGRVQYSVDETGALTEFAYDALGRRTSVKRYLSYVVPAPIETSTIAPPANTPVSLTSYGYDANGNQISMVDGNNRETDYQYDALNRQRVVIYPQVTGDNDHKRTVTDYDGLGRRITEWDEAGIATAFGYDKLGRLTSVTNDFLVADDSQTVSTPVATHYVYDEVGNLTKEIRVTYTADSDGYLLNPDLSEDDSRTTVYEYDKLGRRVRRFLPGATLDDITSNTLLEKTTYTENGSGPKTLHKDVRDFRGKTLSYDYDSMDRLVTKTLPQVTSGVDVARTITYTYAGGLLTQVAESGTGIARTAYYAYDNANRLRKKDTPEGVLTYTYNARSQVQRTQGFRRSAVAVNAEVGSAVPDVDVEYGYDTLGRLWTVKDWKQSGSNVSTNVYDGAGVLAETWYPNTVRQKFDHTEQNRLSKVSWEQNTGSAMVARKRLTYQLNATGQRTQLDEDDGAAVLRTVKYAYDSAVSPPVIGVRGAPAGGTDVSINIYQRVPKVGRLTEESVVYPNGSPLNADYTYDLVGNRLKRQNGTAIDAALTDQNLSFDAKDRFGTSGAPVNCDANGNSVTSASGTVTDSYDAENRLVKRTAPSSVTIKLTYDHDGNRVGKQVQTGSTYLNTYYLVDDKNPSGYAQVLVEYQDTGATPNAANGAFYISYIHGQNVLWQHTASGATYYYGYDGQGSVRGIMNTSGSIVKTYSYDAWGTMLAPTTSPIDDRYLYTGQQWDKDLGMYYLRARYYAPQYGRFWTMDTFEGSQNGPESLHKYLYCTADPVNRIDLSGHDSLISISATMGIMGFANRLELQGANAALQKARALFGADAQVDSLINGMEIASIVDEKVGYVMMGGAAIYGGFKLVNALRNFVNSGTAARVGEAILLNLQKLARSGTSACFIAGTLVDTELGKVPIEQVRVDDYVWSWSEETGTITLQRVTSTSERMSYALIDLQIEGDVITVTPEHPFQVAGRGWVSANDLEIGDQVSSERSAPLRIESKITRQECTRVFNFQVENTHTYLIGRDGVVVHNSCAWTTRAASLPKGVPGIYIIKTPRGDKYVGQATDLAERLSDSAHKHAALIRDPANELYTIGLNTTKWKGSVRDGIDMAEEFYIRALGAKGGSSNPSGLNRRFEVNQADLEKLVNQFGFPDLNAPTSH